MNVTALIRPFLRILRSIGRWVLLRLAAKGASKLVGYMDGKIDEFGRRLQRARTKLRQKWLAGRIKRWSAALKWLEANAARLTGSAVSALDKAAGAALERVPMRAANDTFTGYVRQLHRGPSRRKRGRRRAA